MWEKSGINYTKENIAKNFATVQIYFEDFTTEKIIHKSAYDPNQFWSELGGQVGLWIGASGFSFLELASLLVQLLYSSLRSKKTKECDLESGDYPVVIRNPVNSMSIRKLDFINKTPDTTELQHYP